MATENVKLGVCNVFFDGVELGLTKGGVEVEVTTNTHEVKVDQFGETTIGEIITGRMVMAKIPLAETTLDNLVKIMPGAVLTTDGAFSTGTITFGTVPVNNDSVTVAGTTFTFKTVPVLGTNDMAIPATVAAAATALAAKLLDAILPVRAVAAAAVVTVTYESRGVIGNIAVTKTGASMTVVGLTGGVDVTAARVDVATGVNINLLTIAKVLVMRPIGTNGEDDFTILRAACPGGLKFTYSIDQERIYNADFKGYVTVDGLLFRVGK